MTTYLSSARLGLEEDGLLVSTLRARMVLCAWQCRICDHVRDDLCQFAGNKENQMSNSSRRNHEEMCVSSSEIPHPTSISPHLELYISIFVYFRKIRYSIL